MIGCNCDILVGLIGPCPGSVRWSVSVGEEKPLTDFNTRPFQTPPPPPQSYPLHLLHPVLPRHGDGAILASQAPEGGRAWLSPFPWLSVHLLPSRPPGPVQTSEYKTIQFRPTPSISDSKIYRSLKVISIQGCPVSPSPVSRLLALDLSPSPPFSSSSDTPGSHAGIWQSLLSRAKKNQCGTLDRPFSFFFFFFFPFLPLSFSFCFVSCRK
jgi:hypothetical protein